MFWKKRTYLDYAAGASGNPSSPHEEGRKAKKVLEDARTTIARLVEVKPDDVIFTSGATEANALAILGTVRGRGTQFSGSLGHGPQSLQKLHATPHVLFHPSAHASIVENAKLLAAEGVTVEALPIKNARVDCEALAKMLREETVLVSMDAVCGETGVVWNTREVAHLLRSFADTVRKSSARAARPVQHDFLTASAPVLHIDASQAPLTEKISRAHFDADMLTLDGSKVGPSHFAQCGGRGIGALIARRTIPMMPLYRGGGQERGLRSGSESPELAREFAAALRAATLGHEAFRASAERERAYLTGTIIGTIPNLHIHEGRRQAPHILNLSLPGRDTDYLVALLDEAGFAVSTRSACETDSEEGSRAVFALTGDRAQALSTLRISWGPTTPPRDLTRFAAALAKAVAFLDSD